MEGPATGPTVCQCRESSSNEIPWTWHQGQLKEWAGFLVSRSPTLFSAYVHIVGGSRQIMIFPAGPKKGWVLCTYLGHNDSTKHNIKMYLLSQIQLFLA